LLFVLNETNRELRLAQQLDREVLEHHSIRIIATNQDTKPIPRLVSDNAFLIINVSVEDVNDNPPSFVYKKYSAGISDNDGLGKVLFTLEATDPDLEDIVTFQLLKDTIIVSNEEKLSSFKDTAFSVNPNSGALSLNFRVVSKEMSGFFEFEVEARDLMNHTDTASVKIYIISELNRVPFTFHNTTSEMQNVDRDALVKIFSDHYEASCVIDEITPNTEGGGDSGGSIMRVHFLRDDEAIDADKINDMSVENDFFTPLVARLKYELKLVLTGIPTTIEEIDNERSRILEIVLSIIVGILAVALALLVFLYILQLRNYKRQIEALSEKKFEPTAESFYNLKAVPNTNLYSEGKQVNPATVNTFPTSSNVDLDTRSIISSDSDDFANLNDSHIFDISSKFDKNPSTFA
jgi:hypothetical protein